ncbi:hypothetical protein [Acinetobacter sp. CFCC 10889]|uniref:hypothetical protein n=1 Tax=Acinetobacter sp. CFCC 10889 TaxID=1775557 RepID=UPI001D195EC5|nr:hypothetical protein [Acinetobacter sp. CFCC 10889]
MSWVAAGVGAATVVSGLVSGSKASKQQKKEFALKQEALAFDKQRYSDATDLYSGSIKGLVDLANDDVSPDLGGVTSRALADVSTQFDNAQEILARQNARMGINPNSGQAQASMRQTALAEALAKSGITTAAREQERVNANNQHWNRLNTVATLGVNQINGTAANVNQSANSLANSYGRNADYLNQASSNAISSGLGAIAGADWGGLGSSSGAQKSAPSKLGK